MLNWTQSLLAWFETNAREMPWRSEPAPYRVWISEIMLQQTQVATVIPYFNHFMEAFPTLEALANADQERVLKLWEGLGYYSRARNLHKAAGIVCGTYNGTLPDTFDELQKLPGIGSYTAAAIASIAFGKATPVIDGNVLRVYARLKGIDDDIAKQKTKDRFFNELRPAIKRSGAPSSFNQGMMELGALVCKPLSPNCSECPLHTWCVARKKGRITELPVKRKKQPTPHYSIAVGLIWDGDNVFIQRRDDDQMLGGLWEFPGGKLEPGEMLQQTVVREIKEETGFTVNVTGELGTIRHAYSHFKITLTAYHCEISGESREPIGDRPYQWVTVEQFDDLPFPTANKKLFALL